MVRELMHDPLFLARKSTPPTAEDLPIARDLMDTLLHHREGCEGMAANMIGQLKRIIVFFDGDTPQLMLDPVILKASEPYDTEEGCLSLLGGPRRCKRFRKIKVQYKNEVFQTRTKTYQDFTAQIIQHEVDHCDGVLI